MSASSAHAAAARQNGAQSHGPVTAEGKARSSQSARRHGFFGATALLAHEDRQAFDQLLEEYIAEYQPATATERRYLREMVDSEWRLTRVREHIAILHDRQIDALPAGAREDSAAAAFEKMADTSNALQLALRYERHFQRQYEKAYQELLRLRHMRHVEKRIIGLRPDHPIAGSYPRPAHPPLPDLQNEPSRPAPHPPQTSRGHAILNFIPGLR
jgi:hypothetical protein